MTTLILFRRLILRPLLSDPLRTALNLIAVMLGVAVIVAIDLAGEAAAGSFHSSVESLTGPSDLVITGTGGIDEQYLGKLTRLPYAFDFTPRIEDFASINGKGEAYLFLGLDLIGHRTSATFEQASAQHSGQLLATDSTHLPLWIGNGFHRQPGSHLRLLINDRLQDFIVEGIIQTKPGSTAEQNVFVTDIGFAQRVTSRVGKLDSIDVSVPSGQSLEFWRDLLRIQLPPSLSIDPQGARTAENRKMLAAFRWNLHVLSYIAIVVGAFLIYNTISISVVRRRNEIGIVRALGATRTLVAGAFLSEALFFGFIGSLLGLALGRIMAEGAVQLVGSTVQSLYVSSQPSPITMTWAAALTGFLLGAGVSVLAALAPALEATRVPPVEAMARGRQEYVNHIRSRYTIWIAAAMLLIAAALAQLPPINHQPIFAYFATLLLVVGTSLIIPNLVAAFAGLAHDAVARLLGTEALLAVRSLRSSLGRTSVMIAALATAVAMTASVGIMVGSFRQTVWLWMNNELKADFYLRPAGSTANDRHPTISPDIANKIERLPGISTVDRFRVYPITYEGLPASLGGGESSKAESNATTLFLPGEDRDSILRKLPTGDYAVVSEPFANKHNIHPGSRLALPLGLTTRSFEVLGIYYDYSTERGFVVIDRHTLLKYLPDPAASNMAVFLKPGANEVELRRAIDNAIGGRSVSVLSNRTLRHDALTIFDRTFRITYALEAVAILVAVLGIAGSLLAVVIDRRREFAILRILGASKLQIRSIILCEAGLLGILSNAIGIILGAFLSLILIYVINKQSFGWTIQFHPPVAALLAALTGIYVATVLAGLYPARTAIRLNPIEVIHED